MRVDLRHLVVDVAAAIAAVDATRPTAINQRSKAAFHPGLGPHSESAALTLVMKHLALASPERYAAHKLGVSYPDQVRQKCDLCLGTAPVFDWAVEVKLLRLMGDNGQPNDNMLMHILSPYRAHRSAVTDCEKLTRSPLGRRRAILIYGFDHLDWPMRTAIDAFEVLARSKVLVGDRFEASFDNLVHPVHSSGAGERATCAV